MTDYIEIIRAKVRAFREIPETMVSTEFLDDVDYLIRRLEEREAKVRALGNELSRLRKAAQHQYKTRATR